MTTHLLLAALISAFASAVLCPIVIAVGVFDSPDANRKTHRLPTPTSGGLAAASAFALTILVLSFWPWASWTTEATGQGLERTALASMAAFVALGLGLWDDIVPLPARLKFGLLTAVSLFIAVFVAHAQIFPIGGPIVLRLAPIIGVVGSALWVFTMANTVNFMDGANGLAMGSAAVGTIALGMIGLAHGAPHAAVLCFACAGALIGLIVWNFPHGQVFAGDAGALFVGVLAAAAGLLVVQDGKVSPVVPALVFFPLLADVLLTLAYRARRRRNLLDGHREHLFQIWIRAGFPHWQVTLVYWGAMLHCSVIAFLVSFGSRIAPPALFAPQPGDVPANYVALVHAAGWIASASPLLALAAFALAALKISSRTRRFAEARDLDTP